MSALSAFLIGMGIAAGLIAYIEYPHTRRSERRP